MPNFSSKKIKPLPEQVVLTKKPLRVAINGFGRIGRNVLRVLLERGVFSQGNVQLVAINDVAEAESLIHLLKYDTTHGRLTNIGYTASIINKTLEKENPDLENHKDYVLNNSLNDSPQNNTNGQYLYIEPFYSSLSNDHYSSQASLSDFQPLQIKLLNETNPINLPWHVLQVDLVLECSGHFRSYEGANKHRHAGAKQVIIGAAPFDDVDECIVIGVNDELLTRQLPIISSVSCTTQALVPLISTLDKAFVVKSVMMTEIHAVTADQNVLDQAHRDLRRARASGYNIITTTSSSIAATERVLPKLKGRINGYSIRVPTMDVAAIDVTFTFEKSVHIDEVKQLLRSTASLMEAGMEVGETDNDKHNELVGIMGYTDEPLVSSDFIHRSESLIVDEGQLMQVGEQVKVFAWYDNEWGYANRLVDMCLMLQTR